MPLDARDSHIVRMLNDMTLVEKGTGGAPPGAGNGVVGVDLCPASLEKEIDEMNDFVYEKVLVATIFHIWISL